MTDDALLGPVPRYAVTTVIGGSGLEAARLTAATAISVTTGREIVPGWKPASAEEVTVFCYGGDWVFWKSLVVDICHATKVAVPMIGFRFPTDPLTARPAEEPDPDLAAYDAPYPLADAAAAEGAVRIATNRLFVVVGLAAAVDYGMDGAMLQLLAPGEWRYQQEFECVFGDIAGRLFAADDLAAMFGASWLPEGAPVAAGLTTAAPLLRISAPVAARPPGHCPRSPDGEHRYDRDRVCRVCFAADRPLEVPA